MKREHPSLPRGAALLPWRGRLALAPAVPETGRESKSKTASGTLAGRKGGTPSPRSCAVLLMQSAAGLLAALTWAAAANGQAAAPASAPAMPFVSLYDTVTPGKAAPTAEELARRTGWKAVAEADLKHAFAGDAVIMTDRLAVVLRPSGGGALVYSTAGGKLRAWLTPGDSAGKPAGQLSAVKVVENSSAAVAVEGTYKTGGRDSVTVRFRLAAGTFFLEVRGQDGGTLRVCHGARYVVVPDFFGDDLVYAAAAAESGPVVLPAENALLALADGGQAIVACVWSSPAQRAHLHVPLDGVREANAAANQIDLPAGKRVWLAVFEGKDIWHVRPPAAKEEPGNLALDWKPPFDAKWRASLVACDASARSWNFTETPQAGEGAAGKADGATCWFDAGRAFVRLPTPVGAGDSTGRPAGAAKAMVVYPIDRSRATPLMTYCLVDLMRDTLGVGPCQYVLDAEGLGSADAATPEPVTHWVEKQFERKPSRRDPDEIRERLAAMVRQVQAQQARIEQYRQVAGRVRDICRGAEATDKTGLSRQMLAIAEGMASPPQATPPPTAPTTIPEIVKDLASQVAALADKDDAFDKGRDSLGQIRQAGARQDYELARLRMAARRLNVLCPTDADGDSPAARVRREIQALVLKKAPAAAPKPVIGR